MMPIATISLVTADQLSCRLAAADDHAWPECTSTARNDHSFVCESQPIRLISPAEPGAPLPALSFFGGFRTTAPVLVASSETGRHPKPVTKPAARAAKKVEGS
jgi:hypothetical protein